MRTRVLIALDFMLTFSATTVGAGGIENDVAPSLVGISPGVTSFVDIVKILGPAEVISGGEAGPATLCYRSALPRDDTVLIFESAGPGGYGDQASAYRIVAHPPKEVRAGCSASTLVSSRLALPNGIHLGMPCQEARRRSGKDARPIPGGFDLAVQSKRDMTAQEIDTLTALRGGERPRPTIMLVSAGTRIRCSGEAVSEIEVYRLETY